MKKILLFFAVGFLVGRVITSQLSALTLQWDERPSEEEVTSYKIYRIDGDIATLIGATVPPTTTFSIDQFLVGEQTAFIVTAVNATAEGPMSSKASIVRCVTWSVVAPSPTPVTSKKK
jgi:hypothetical protein